MEYVKLCDSDYRFMCVVWEHAPVNSGELVKLCQEQLGWKKSTTYTVVRKGRFFGTHLVPPTDIVALHVCF